MRMKICVLQPDYSTTDVDYKNYDPPRNLAPLYPDAQVDHVFLNKLTTYKQLKALHHKGYDVFVNLCEAYLEWSIPSIDVIHSLELLNLPFTGPNSRLYDPPKELMKYVAYCENVLIPAYALIETKEDLETQCKHLQFPLFVKPAKAGDSLGIDHQSLVHDKAALANKVNAIIDDYAPLLVEEYIAGREFTVMLAAMPGNKAIKTFKPVEYIFPENFAFKTYSLKTSELHPNANIPVTDAELANRLQTAAAAIFKSFNGVGYARLDFRMNEKGELYFLEINFTCSVFYSDGMEGSADYILHHDGFGQANFLQLIVAEGIERHQKSQKKYRLQGNSIAGYGIYATVDIAPNSLIFNGEERSQRVVTRQHVQKNWSDKDKETFARYAYAISNQVFLLWDDDPSGWAPQNHSCHPNTAYDGLNVVAIQPIKKGDELTLDYATFLDENMQPFQCQCGAPNCRGQITGTPGNTITQRENLRQL
jgi:hypothetical protein